MDISWNCRSFQATLCRGCRSTPACVSGLVPLPGHAFNIGSTLRRDRLGMPGNQPLTGQCKNVHIRRRIFPISQAAWEKDLLVQRPSLYGGGLPTALKASFVRYPNYCRAPNVNVVRRQGLPCISRNGLPTRPRWAFYSDRCCAFSSIFQIEKRLVGAPNRFYSFSDFRDRPTFAAGARH